MSRETDGRIDGNEELRSEIDALRRVVKEHAKKIDLLSCGECLGTVEDSFVACGESDDYGYCSKMCELRANRRIVPE